LEMLKKKILYLGRIFYKRGTMKTNKQRIVLIYGGGDWADASCDDLKIPEGMDLDKEKIEYDHWLNNVYQPTDNNYMNFVEFLLSKGARRAGLEKFDDSW